MSVLWAETKLRFTALFERLVINTLQANYVEGARKILRVSWDEAWGIMERAVSRGKKRKKRRVVRKMGVDEKSATASKARKLYFWLYQFFGEAYPRVE